MKLRQKLLASYFIITILALIPSLAGLNSYGKLYSQYISMTQDILVGQQALVNVKQSALTMIVESRDYLRTGDEINAQFARQSMDVLRESLRTHAEYEAHIGEAEQDVAEEMERGGLHLIDLCSNLMAAYQRGVSEEILSQGRTDIRMCKDDLFDTLDEHLAIHEQELLDVQAGNYTAIIRSLWTLLAGCVLIVAAGLTSAFYTAKSIVKPIREFETGVGIIGSGDLTYRLNIETGDEIEQLAVAFNAMVDRLDNMMHVLEQRVTERKRAEEEITRLATVIEQATVTVVITDLDGNITYTNSYFETSTGYTAAQVLGENPRILKSGQQDVSFYQTLWDTITTGKPWEGTFINKRKDGSIYHESAAIFPIQDAAGQTINYAAVKRDITARVLAEEKQRESEHRYRALFEHSHDAIFILDLEGVHLEVNQQAADLLGYTKDEIINMALQDVVAPDNLVNAQDRLATLLDGQTLPIYERVFRHKDGSDVDVEINAALIRDVHGNPLHIQSVVRDITTRKQAEKLLKKSEERYRRLFELLPYGAEVIDPQGQIIDCNPYTARMLGYEREELIGKSITIVFTPESIEVFRKKFSSVMSGNMERVDTRMVRKDGSIIDVLRLGRPIYDAGGKVSGLLAVNVDITKRVQAEKSLRIERDNLKNIFEAMEDGIYIVNQQYDIQYVNSVLIKDFGNYEGRKCYEYFHARTEVCPWCKNPDVFAGKTVQWEWFSSNNGKTYDLFDTPITNPDGSISKLEIFHDITERVRAQGEMQQRTEELSTLSQLSSDMRVAQNHAEISTVILQQVMQVFKASGAALGRYDEQQNEILIEQSRGDWANWAGKSISASLGVSGQVITTSQPYLNNDIQTDELFYHKDLLGEVLSVACVPLSTQDMIIGLLWLGSQMPIADEQIRLLSAIGDMAATAIHRQSLHQRLEEQVAALQIAQARLVQSEKLAAIGELTAGVAHELNNPLTSILLLAEIVQRRSADQKNRSDLKKIVSESLRAADIVHGLLDFARQRPPERKPIQINDILQSSLDLVAYELTSRGIKWIPHLAPDVPITMADPHQLQQVFINLLNNALQSMAAAHSGGALQIRTEVGPSTFHATAAETTPVIRVSIQDDGPGISPDHILRIFDPFFTTKPEGEGSGLGLSICHGIISEHDGYIWAESEPGQGAAFIIELPIIAPTRKEWLIDKDDPSLKASSSSIPERVMLIDDETNILEVLATILRRQGYLVDAVDNGINALQLLSEFSYALILCDIHMPGISGLKFYRRVQQEYPHLVNKIIFITGDTVSRSTRHFFDETGVSCLVKPFEMDELIQLVSTAVSKNQSTRV